MKISTRSITLAATLTALCAVTGIIPYVFFLPVMVAATTLSVGMAAFVGLAFGAISIAYSFIMPTTLVAAAFIQAPYIAIVPRILAALGAFGIYKLLSHFFKPQKKPARVATVAGAAAVGSILNTALVVGMFMLVMPSFDFGGVTLIVAVPQLLISGAIECACMAILTPPVTLTLDKVVLKKNRLSPVPYTDSVGASDTGEGNTNTTEGKTV
ncbi:MAG: hypothetical protein HDT28_05525 [Clostridiales bacterium]|nr:hypothetical protein [Clostridiales bacterium]